MRRGRIIDGFSMFEVLGSLSIVIILLVFTAETFSKSHQVTRQVESLLAATAIADQVLEKATRQDFTSIVNSSGSEIHTLVYNNTQTSIVYNYKLTVTSINAKLKNVTVTVTWLDRNKTRELKVQTLVFNQK